MIRSVAIALVLLISFLPAGAQQRAAAARTHVVLPGETLGSIARQYLGSAAEWARIFEANRGQLSDPNRIRVGMELVLPGAAPALAPAATVLGVQVDGRPAVTVATLPFEERRAMLESRPFTPGNPPERDLATRTVFFDSGGPEVVGPIVMTQGEADTPAVPEGVFLAAGWIVSEGDGSDRMGEVVGLASPGAPLSTSVSIQPGAEVVLRFFGEGTPRVGEEFLTYALGARIPGLGDVTVPSGIVRIEQVDPSAVVARVVDEFGRLRVGHLLTLARTFPLSSGVHPAPSDSGVRARLLAFQERKELHLPGDFAFIDQGGDAGLVVGDELAGIGASGGDGAEREVARFQVVGIRDSTATVRLLSVATPGAVRAGLWMVLDSKMP
ncbi:MAG: LysM domain-containing protein [Gemmatimonadota bacterium]